jgi:hypothetical protein
MAAAIVLRGGLRGGRSAEACEGEPGCPADAAASGAGGDLRRRLPYGGGTRRWCHLADHPGLGAAVQRGGPAGADRPQGARKACAPAGGTSRGARRGRRGGAEAVSRWGGSLAPRRARAVALGALRAFGQSADPGPGVAGDGLCQALRPAAALRAGSGGRGPVQKSLPDAVAAIRARLPAGTPVELWFQDEARIGQKNKIARRWARRGTRPRAPHDQRTKWAYIFGAICPEEGKGAGLVMPYCDTPTMQAHLREISAAVAPGAHAVLILDQAGYQRPLISTHAPIHGGRST